MRWSSLVAMVLAMASIGTVHAAHPLETEDTGTQGAGNVEFENGLSSMRFGADRVFVYQPQISYGLLTALDIIVQPSWLRDHVRGGPVVHGLGDTALDGKWRFFGEAPLSLALRAGVLLPTSRNGLGAPHGHTTAHAVFVATYDAAPFTLHGNLELAENPDGADERKRIGRVSGALMWAATGQWVLTVDGGAQASTDRTRHAWPATLLAGAIYTVRPGLDVDFGYQSSLAAATTRRQWLFGATWRFAP